MLEPWTATGDWWLPNAPEKRWSGTLKWEPRGRTQLELAGVIEASDQSSERFKPGPVVILGQTHDGRIYTCLRTHFAGRSSGFHGPIHYVISRLDVDVILANVHFNDLQEARFGRMRFRYSNLHEWYWGTSAMTMKEIPSEEGEFDGKECQVTHARRKLWEVIAPGGHTIESDYKFHSEHTEDVTPQITFTHTDGILVTAGVPVGLGEIFRAAERNFRTLVHLLAEYPLELASVEAAREPDGETDIKVYSPGLLSHLPRCKRDPQLSPILFKHLGPRRFEAILRTWLEVEEKVRLIVNLYLSDRLKDRLELSGTFLQIMQALEAYHHIFYSSHVYMDREEYKRTVASALTEAIPAAVTRPLRDKLKSMVKYGYEYSLFRKLEELIKELPDGPLQTEVLTEGFLRRSVDTRNYLVHRDPEAQANALKDAELYRAVCAWQEVIFAMLLKRTGLSADEINRGSAMQHDRRGQYFVLAEPI